MLGRKNTLIFHLKHRLNSLLMVAVLILAAEGVRAGSDQNEEVKGMASYYSQRLIGKPTTSGELYDQKAFTAAHAYHPLGTYLLVTHEKNKQSVVVRVNDRFRPRKGHLADLSMAAAEKIGLVSSGRARISIRVLDEKEALSMMKEKGQTGCTMRLDSVSVSLSTPEPMALLVTTINTRTLNDHFIHVLNR